MYSRPVFDALGVIGNSLSELDALAELCVANDAALKGKLEELHAKMDEDVAALHGRDEGDYLADINDHYIMVSITMPMFQNYAMFTLGFSFFEKCLNDVAAELWRVRALPVDLKDINGQGIARAKVYLTKVCGVTAPFEGAAWAQVSLFNEIRNAISHRGGFVDFRPDDRKSLYARLKELPEIELDQVWDISDQPDRQIGFQHSYVLASLNHYTTVMRSLWDALK